MSSIHDMIASYRYNRGLRNKKNPFKKDKSYSRLKGQFEKKAEKDNLQLKEATKAQLTAIREKIVLEKRVEKIMRFVVVIISVPMLIFGVYAYYDALKPGPPHDLRYQMAMEKAETERQEQYTYFISSGDKWLAQYNWYNAIFEYKKALELSPADYTANYRLALAYTYNCQDTKENCDEAEQLILKLLQQDTNNPELHLLRASYLVNTGDSAKAMLEYERVDMLLQMDSKFNE